MTTNATQPDARFSKVIKYPGNEYEQFTYPAGEIQVRLKPETASIIRSCDSVDINATILGASAIMSLLLLTDAIRGVKPGIDIILNTPYLPYARADRRFTTEGDCYGLQVLGSVLKLGNYKEIRTLDVHNRAKAWEKVSDFLVNVDPVPFVMDTLGDVLWNSRYTSNTVTLLWPDQSAGHRYKLPEGINELHAVKHRDAGSGVISSRIELPNADLFSDEIVMVDDICDGGATFINVARALREKGVRGRLYLYVSHGIFSKGMEILFDHFAKIYTTNSIQQDRRSNDKIKVYDAFDLTRHGGTNVPVSTL